MKIGNSPFLLVKVRRSLRVGFSRPIPTMYCLHAGPLYVAFWKQGQR